MSLNGEQIGKLATAINQHLNLPSLTLLAADLGVNLANIAPEGDVKRRAFTFINYMATQLPPRDGELLEKLRDGPNAALQTLAKLLLRPSYFSPTGNPHDAILLGRTAFVDRAELRKALHTFTEKSSNYSTRVLIVRGDQPGGKSYSWRFLQHLAGENNARAVRLRLEGTSYTPRQFFEQIFLLLSLPISRLPTLSDDPQQTRIDSLINAFRGEIVNLTRRYWLVIDDLNNDFVTPPIREAALAVACAVEDQRPENLWVALLGYNREVVNDDLRHSERDDAEFPSREAVGKHFELIAAASPRPLTEAQAREEADRIFQKFPRLDKAAMNTLTVLIERRGEDISAGR